MNIAVILAAGKGKRFGQAKQFVLIKDKPVIVYSLEKFNQSKYIDRIVVVTLKSKLSHIEQLVKMYHLNKITDIVVGGKERQDSVSNALNLLPDQGYVVIHDSARPFFNPELIEHGFKQVKKYQACIPVLPVQDTIKQIRNARRKTQILKDSHRKRICENLRPSKRNMLNQVVRTIDRSDLYCVQTPQFFAIKLLKKAYQKAYQEGYYATDDASLVERIKHKVYTFAGHKQNIKITDPSDLNFVRNARRKRNKI